MDNLKWQVGDISITKIVEVEFMAPGGGSEAAIPAAYPDEIKKMPWLIPDFANEAGELGASMHALLVETPDTRLIVDTCVGNDKQRQAEMWNELSTDFLDRLERAGWTRDNVDGVICTHLHFDHIGWNTVLEDGKWVPHLSKRPILYGENGF